MSFLSVMAMIPLVGLSVLWIIQRMVAGDLSFLPGFYAISALVGCLLLAVFAGDPNLSLILLLAVAALMAFTPYAEEYLARVDLEELSADRLQRAHDAIRARPDNAAAWLALAQGLYEFGLPGHAVAIADRVLGSMSTSRDPMSMRSNRDLFANEDRLLKKWKASLRPGDDRPSACPRCGHKNLPGEISCAQCQSAYLLDIARKMTGRTNVLGRLVVGFASVALCFAAAAWSAMTLSSPLNIGVSLLGVVLLGVALAFIFRPWMRTA